MDHKNIHLAQVFPSCHERSNRRGKQESWYTKYNSEVWCVSFFVGDCSVEFVFLQNHVFTRHCFSYPSQVVGIERGPYIWTIKVAKKKGHIIQIFDDVTWILTEKDSPLSNSVWSVADNENQKSLLIARILLLLHINMFSDYMNHTIPHHVIIVKVFQASPDPGPVRPGKSAEILLT